LQDIRVDFVFGLGLDLDFADRFGLVEVYGFRLQILDTPP
jgi:hypothetical protein